MQVVRVLHILHSMDRGGAENAIMNYYRHVDREKLQFDFLLTMAQKCKFEDEILSLGGKVYRVPLLTLRNPFPYITGVYHFLCRHKEYRIVHSHTSSKSTIPLAIAKFRGVPIRIAHSHSSITEDGLYGFIRRILMLPLKNMSTHLFACGKSAGIWLYGKRTFKKGEVHIIRNVIEASKFRYSPEKRLEIRKHLGVSNDTVLLGEIARFSYPKNQIFTIEILDVLIRKGYDAKLLLVGGGDDEFNLKEKVRKKNLNEYVIFTGVVTNVYDYEQAIDFFLLPSFFEGLPLSLVEAQTSGLQCFASKGCPKESNITGLVHFYELDKGAEFWAEQIVNYLNYLREDHYSDICKAGYNAEDEALKLQNFYLNI